METLNPPLPKGRLIPINGDAVRMHRLQRKWDVDRLASKADCSSKTIQNIEKGGKRVYAVTLVAIAQALDVQHSDLVAGPMPAQPASQVRRFSGVSIHFTLNFQNVDASDELVALMERLAAAIGATAEIEVFTVDPGSLIVGVGMSEEDVFKLIDKFAEQVQPPSRPQRGKPGSAKAAVWALDEIGVNRLELESTPTLLRIIEFLRTLGKADYRDASPSLSVIGSGYEDIWYIWKMANAKYYPPHGPVRYPQPTFQELMDAAAAQGFRPTDEQIFLAGLCMRCQDAGLVMQVPTGDGGEKVRIIHLGNGGR